MDNKVFQAYYTKSSYITSHMVSSLCLNGDERILEPCAGDGVFIDEILNLHPNATIDAFELNPMAYQGLIKKYEDNTNIKIKHTDTLLDSDLELRCTIGYGYDAIIANPPYGAWRDVEERKDLKKLFNGLYSKESYTLFLRKCISALRIGGKLSFIIPDTYLYLNRHKELRRIILEETKVLEISLFPSSFFPKVNFGYANLSIITLEKGNNANSCLKNTLIVKSEYKSVEKLQIGDCGHIAVLKQSEIYNNTDHLFIITKDNNINSCLLNSTTYIGDICDCVTGFYSGNDKECLKVISKEIRNSKRYQIVDNSDIEYNNNYPNLVDGIPSTKSYIPIVKGGNTKYYKPNNWFMLWTEQQVDFYKKNKKSRFQNSSYYFRNGIAVPMVSSTSITGSLLDHRLFDQSIVGIFPKKIDMLYYLLAFFNSPTCNKLIRTINSSTNNSSNYIKKIPFVNPSERQKKLIETNITTIISQIKNNGYYDLDLETSNNQTIADIYGF